LSLIAEDGDALPINSVPLMGFGIHDGDQAWWQKFDTADGIALGLEAW